MNTIKFPEPHILDKVDDLVDTLNDMVADPMWPDHVEIKKETLSYVIDLLKQLAAPLTQSSTNS
jgi:hypothetical protein